MQLIPEALDKSISTFIAVSSAGLGFWAHRRQLVKERRKIEADAKREYAEKELKAYAAQRDFGHIQRDLDQLKANTLHLSEETDERLDKVERQLEKLSGGIDVLKELLKGRRTGES